MTEIKRYNSPIRIRIKLRLFCLDKMGLTKGLRQKFVLDFVITLRPLQGRLKSFLK